MLAGWSERWRVLGYAACIYLVYITQGIIYEQLHYRDFGTAGHPLRWNFPDVVMCCTLSGNIVVAQIMLWVTGAGPNKAPQSMFVSMAFPVFLAGGLTMYSMAYVR